MTWNHKQCMSERDYIRSVNPEFVGHTFNHDPDCFARYCDMQAKEMRRAGWFMMAEEISEMGALAVELAGEHTE